MYLAWCESTMCTYTRDGVSAQGAQVPGLSVGVQGEKVHATGVSGLGKQIQGHGLCV